MVSTCVHPETDGNIDMEVNRLHQARLPNEDRHEVAGTYSENIFYAAQALVGGYRVRGIETWTEELRFPAQQLCATFHALRLQCKQAAMQSTSRDTSSFFALFSDFDAAWCDFERGICAAYFAASLIKAPLRETADSEVFVTLLSETLTRAIERDLFPMDDVIDYEPYLMFALPRLAIIYALKHKMGWSLVDNAEKAATWFGSTSFALFKQIRTSLARFSESCLQDLELLLTDRPTLGSTSDAHRSRRCSKDSDDIPLAFVTPHQVNTKEMFKLVSSIADELHSNDCAAEMVQILRQTFDAAIAKHTSLQ